MSNETFLQFPKDFLWGTSTAAAQTETASDHNWRGVKAKDGFVFNRTTDHEKRRKDDLRYIKQFGTVYRCGVDWARLQPAPMQAFQPHVVREYQAFFQELIDEGMGIMFVMHHFTNPTWFEKRDSWLNEDNIPYFIDFCKQCIEHFGIYVSYWNTFNEPNVYALNGFVLGNFPPFAKNIFKGNKALQNMGAAHDILYVMLKEFDADLPVGISLNTCYFKGLNLLGKMVASFTDWWFITFASSFFKKLDFWGLSYYAYIPFKPMAITEIDNPGKLASMKIPHDKMWGYYPQGFKEIMHRIYKKYGKPIIVTENGICTDDPQVRIESIKTYLQLCHQAIQEGIPLKGYIHWSTWDNFEWNLGPTYRFGLVRINLDTMERSMTAAGEFYSQICKQNGVKVK